MDILPRRKMGRGEVRVFSGTGIRLLVCESPDILAKERRKHEEKHSLGKRNCRVKTAPDMSQIVIVIPQAIVHEHLIRPALFVQLFLILQGFGSGFEELNVFFATRTNVDGPNVAKDIG